MVVIVVTVVAVVFDVSNTTGLLVSTVKLCSWLFQF